MKGLYNGVTMKLRYLFPPNHLDRIVGLSPEALRRLAWFDFYVGHDHNGRLTCRHFGLSPDTFYLWKRRFNPRDLKTLEDDKRTRRPRKLRTMTTPPEIIQQVIETRRGDLEKSKYEIAEELRRQGTVLGTSTIQKIINRHPELSNAQHIKKVHSSRKRSIARIKAARELKNKYPGSLVQIDTKHLYILGKRFYLFCAIDGFSRYGYVSVFETGSSKSARMFLRELQAYLPFKIVSVQTDNGSEYLLNFHQGCQDLGIEHYFADPYCPKQNGRVERFIKTAVYEFFNHQEDLLPETTQIQERCWRFNLKYNYQRFHQALRYRTPKEHLETIEYTVVSRKRVYGI